jgi:agmatinase
VPFDATTSYGNGAAKAPEAIVEASHQIELFHEAAGEFWNRGIVLVPDNHGLEALSEEASRHVRSARAAGADAEEARAEVNRISAELDAHVREGARRAFDAGRQVGVIGGDHATALGLIEETSARHEGVGILWIDAHHDLRCAYEGFERSHASVLFNVLEKCPGVSRVVQVGTRDFCAEEQKRVVDLKGRVVVHTDESMAKDAMRGVLFTDRIDRIIGALPKDVHVSFDIDGLDPSLCPSTGTPVPGGLSFNQAIALLRAVIRSGRRVVSFDLVEVVPGVTPIDVIVGARILFELCAQLSLSTDSSRRVDG